MSDAAEVVTRFEVNQSGRDFVVGDIHGMFGHLDVLLAEIGFKTEHDRVFSVGDLVDRGPDSRAALDWLDKPWFYACRGNHEQFAIDSLDPEQHEIWVTHNGGEWWLELEAGQHERYREAFSRLPLAIEVETRSGWVGIIHADVPPFLTWDKFMVLLEKHNRDAALYALWSRNRISGSCSTNPVSGRVERVYCGHTPDPPDRSDRQRLLHRHRRCVHPRRLQRGPSHPGGDPPRAAPQIRNRNPPVGDV